MILSTIGMFQVENMEIEKSLESRIFILESFPVTF